MPERFEVDHNKIKWSGFFKSDDAAQHHLEGKVAIYAKKHNILTAQKKFAEKNCNNSLLYYFTVVLAPKL